MVENRGSLTISRFARAVGLSASVLRHYDESGLLVPYEVEERTGYRYYDPTQQGRAVRIRRLREAGMTPAKIRTVLDCDTVQAEALLKEWAAESQTHADAVAALVTDLKRPGNTRIRMDSVILRAAIRQVMLGGCGTVLLETGTNSVTLLNTDRYLLLARTAVPAVVTGPKIRVVLTADSLLDWLLSPRQVDLVVEAPVANGCHGRSAFLDSYGEELEIGPTRDVFPSLGVMQAHGNPVGRIVFDREDVRHVVERCEGRSVVIVADDGAARMGVGGRVVPGVASGGAEVLEVSGAALRAIVGVAVGNELVCEFHGRDRPLLWGAPAQPDFVAMLMARAT